jgi:hypothetical protein
MDLGKASLVICLTLVAVVIVNLIIYYIFRRGIKFNEIEMMRQVTSRSRQPWKKEREDLDELSRLVESLKNPVETRKNEEDE